MSMDKGSLDKKNAFTYLFFYKIIDDELYTISPNHVVRGDLPPLVNTGVGAMKLDGETFKLLREVT